MEGSGLIGATTLKKEAREIPLSSMLVVNSLKRGETPLKMAFRERALIEKELSPSPTPSSLKQAKRLQNAHRRRLLSINFATEAYIIMKDLLPVPDQLSKQLAKCKSIRDADTYYKSRDKTPQVGHSLLIFCIIISKNFEWSELACMVDRGGMSAIIDIQYRYECYI